MKLWAHLSMQAASACMVCRQLGIVSFGALQPYMLDLYTGSHAALPTLPGVPTLAAALDRNWSSSESSRSPTAPALVSFSAASLPPQGQGLLYVYGTACRQTLQQCRGRFTHTPGICIMKLLIPKVAQACLHIRTAGSNPFVLLQD